MKLYPYQESAVDNAIKMLDERKNTLIVAGTGAGKTIMMAATMGKFFTLFKAKHKRNPHILVLVHRTEIHSQNHKKFSLVCPQIQTSEITSARKSLKGNIHFGMVQTVLNILPDLKRAGSYFDLIVIDEAHHSKASTYETIIEWNQQGRPDAALLGVTATPNRGDKLPLVHLFDNFYQITTRFLIDSHYLVRPKFIDLSPTFIRDGEDEKGHLSKHIKNDAEGDNLIRKLIGDYLRAKEPGKTIIFCPSHGFCKKVYGYLKALGRDPAYLWPGIDDNTRRAEIEKFEKGDSEELINVDICTEGYDFPPLRNLVDFDTNGTHGQWVQKVGRVLRTTPGKTTCSVIDFGGNVFLYPDGVETEVNLEGAVKKPKGQKLVERDLFEKKERATSDVLYQDEEEYTPYHLPEGFETLNDSEFGIVFVSCGEKHDAIVLASSGGYNLYTGDKKSLKKTFSGEFSDCIEKGVEYVGNVKKTGRGISNIQIKMLSPEYPTSTLDWDGANCLICWKAWKEVIGCESRLVKSTK